MQGLYLEDLPGAGKLGGQPDLDISMVAVEYQVDVKLHGLCREEDQISSES